MNDHERLTASFHLRAALDAARKAFGNEPKNPSIDYITVPVDDSYAAPKTAIESLIDEFRANPDNPPQRIKILGYPYSLEANRWAAFTNDELAQLADLDESGNYPTRSYFDEPLWQEIKAELERRKQA